jgi:hypothetical protein
MKHNRVLPVVLLAAVAGMVFVTIIRTRTSDETSRRSGKQVPLNQTPGIKEGIKGTGKQRQDAAGISSL